MLKSTAPESHRQLARSASRAEQASAAGAAQGRPQIIGIISGRSRSAGADSSVFSCSRRLRVKPIFNPKPGDLFEVAPTCRQQRRVMEECQRGDFEILCTDPNPGGSEPGKRVGCRLMPLCIANPPGIRPPSPNEHKAPPGEGLRQRDGFGPASPEAALRRSQWESPTALGRTPDAPGVATAVRCADRAAPRDGRCPKGLLAFALPPRRLLASESSAGLAQLDCFLQDTLHVLVIGELLDRAAAELSCEKPTWYPFASG